VPKTTVTTEVIGASTTSPDEAINQAVARATSALEMVERVEVKQVEALLENGNVAGYRVTVEVAYGGDAHVSPKHEDRPRRGTPEYGSPSELLRSHILLKDVSEDQLEALARCLVITPAKRGSGRHDISVDHDRYLAGD
jgi:flavin-binding protein dodecin